MEIVKGLFLLPLTLLLFSPVHAATPTPITFTVNSGTAVPIDIRTVNGIAFITASQNLTFTGGMQGTSSQVFSVIIRTTGDYEIRGQGTFTGTVNDSQSGIIEYVFAATGTMTPYTQDGHVTFSRGADGLEGVHLEGRYHSTAPNVVTITLSLHAS